MKKNIKQVVSPIVGATPTEKTETTALTIVKTGEEPKAEETTAEVIEERTKLGLNLAETMRLVEDLHMKKRHRDRLEMSIDELESFEIKKRDEDLDDKNYYSGCLITIEDDERGKFITKNPAIIADVVKYLKAKFTEKLIEIEASIVLPR